MKERVFKAKRKNWKELPKEKWWVKGTIFELDGNSYIITDGNVTEWEDDSEVEVNVTGYFVDPETICESTGLTDKNSNVIFEWDIVQDAEWEFEGYEPEVKGVVRFMTGTFDSGVYEYNGWVVEEKDKNIDHTPLLQYEKRNKWGNVGFEVIGNIFDNPELI